MGVLQVSGDKKPGQRVGARLHILVRRPMGLNAIRPPSPHSSTAWSVPAAGCANPLLLPLPPNFLPARDPLEVGR